MPQILQMHRVAAGRLGIAALGLIGAAAYWFAEFLSSGAGVLAVITGLVWIDFGMDSPGLEIPFLLVPSLVIGGFLTLAIARFASRRSPAP